MELFADMLQPLMQYIAVTFLVTEVIKHGVRRLFRVDPAELSMLVAIVVGVLISYGWTVSVLPEPARPGFQPLAAILTGIIIAGAAGGVYTWLENLFPWYESFNTQSKALVQKKS